MNLPEIVTELEIIRKHSRELHGLIEGAGASPMLTECSIKAGDLSCELSRLIDMIPLPAGVPAAVPEPEPSPAAAGEEWGIISLMGHVTFAGRVTEEERFGAKLGRCDIPQAGGGFLTRYFTGASLYSFLPCTREVAERHNGIVKPVPPSLLTLPPGEPPGEPPGVMDDDDDEEEGFRV